MGICALSPRLDAPTRVVDLEEILFNVVKNNHLSMAQRFCVGRSTYMEVGWNYVEFSHHLVKFHRPKDKTAADYRNVTLFRTKFVNRSGNQRPQSFTFCTERETTSTCSLEVQKGFTLGAETNLEFALPTAAAPGVEPSKISGGLSGQLSWSKTKGEIKEETLKWSVDSQVEVEKNKTAYAALVVHEENFDAELKLETTLRSRLQNHCVPVMVRRTKDKRLLNVFDIPIAQIALEEDGEEIRPNFDYDMEERSVKITTMGTCKAVYGVEQVIQIETRDVTDADALSSSLLDINLESSQAAATLNNTKDDVTKDDVTEKTPLKGTS